MSLLQPANRSLVDVGHGVVDPVTRRYQAVGGPGIASTTPVDLSGSDPALLTFDFGHGRECADLRRDGMAHVIGQMFAKWRISNLSRVLCLHDDILLHILH